MAPALVSALMVLGLSVATTASAGDDDPQTLVFTGSAYSMGAKAGDEEVLLYTERHKQEGVCEDGRWGLLSDTVSYELPDGKQRARKMIDYSVDVRRPSFELVDLVFDERMAVTNENDQQAAIVYEEHRESDPQRFTVPLNESAVIDAGFDPAMAQHWDALMAGETIDFEFLAAARGELIRFEARQVDSGPRPIKGTHLIRVQPAGFLVTFFVDPLFLGYDDNGYLTDYLGLSNLRRDSGDNYEVHIRYDYQQRPECLPR